MLLANTEEAGLGYNQPHGSRDRKSEKTRQKQIREWKKQREGEKKEGRERMEFLMTLLSH